MFNRSVVLLVALILLSQGAAASGSKNPKWRVHRDIPYGLANGHEWLLDLYVPARVQDPPVIVWVHGGAWRSGSKSDMPLKDLAATYAIASVDYRLSPVARFPAQVHDIKAAIRFLRANASKYGLNAGRIAVAGASAGGHLAALVGVSNGHPELEGNIGTHAGQSSDVQAAISFYGASNLESILAQSTPHGLGVRIPALQLLLGGQPDQKRDLARLASPVRHVDANDPPLLLIHGDQDPQMPINQAHELHGAYRRLKLPVQLEVLHGGAHGGKAFFDETRLKLIRQFLESSHFTAGVGGTGIE